MLIVGAGPAGAAAAVPLAAAGRHVVVVDKAMFPRDKCCGDGLTTLALRELEALGFDPSTVADWQVVSDAVLRSPSGRQVRRAAAARPRDVRRRRATRRSSTRRSSTWRSRPAPRCSRAMAPTAPSRPVPTTSSSGSTSTARRRPLRHRRRRDVEPGPQGARARRAGLPRRVARLPPVRPRRRRAGRRAPVRVVRRRPPARVRLVVPAARRAGQRRLRRAARRHPPGPGHEATVGRPARPAAHARRARPARRPRRAATRRGRSRPASTGPRSPTGGCCSSATRRWPPT